HTRSKRDWSSDVCSSDLYFFLIEAIHQYDKEKVRACLDTAESLIEDREEICLEQLRLLQGYLDRNWEYLQSLEKRGIYDKKQSKIGRAWCRERVKKKGRG